MSSLPLLGQSFSVTRSRAPPHRGAVCASHTTVLVCNIYNPTFNTTLLITRTSVSFPLCHICSQYYQRAMTGSQGCPVSHASSTPEARQKTGILTPTSASPPNIPSNTDNSMVMSGKKRKRESNNAIDELLNENFVIRVRTYPSFLLNLNI